MPIRARFAWLLAALLLLAASAPGALSSPAVAATPPLPATPATPPAGSSGASPLPSQSALSALPSDPPVLLEVVADVRPVTRLSTDPETLLPRVDKFDLVYMAAYFSQPIYVRAVDGSRYAIKDLWHRPEAAQLAQAIELHCPSLPSRNDNNNGNINQNSNSNDDGRDGHVTMRDTDSSTASASGRSNDSNNSSVSRGVDVYTLAPSPSIYPSQCLRGAAAAPRGTLTAPSPPFRWAEQAFGGSPPGSMRVKLATSSRKRRNSNAQTVTAQTDAAAAAADAVETEAQLLAALWGLDDDLIEGSHISAPHDDDDDDESDSDEDEDEDDAHGRGISDNMLPLVFISSYHATGTGTHDDKGKPHVASRAPALAACATAAAPALTPARLATCRAVLPAPVAATGTPTGTPTGTDVASTVTKAPGIAIVGARGAAVHSDASTVSLSLRPSAPVTVREGAPVRLVSVAGPALDAPAPSHSTDAHSEADANAAAVTRLSRARALVDARRAACASTVSQERAAFIERSMATVGGLVQPVVKTMMGDVVEQSNDLVLGGTAQPLTQDMTHAMTGPMPGMIVAWVNKAVPRNLTHLITDAVAATLTDLLANAIPNAIAGPISEGVFVRMGDTVSQRLTRVLSQTLTRGIHDGLGEVIARELTLALTSKLTRSVTHALVPTLTRGLSTTYHFSYLCHLCTHFGTHCSDCNDLQVSQYQIQHYALQFSEYYAGYYGDYYRDAMFMLDQLEFTNPNFEYQVRCDHFCIECLKSLFPHIDCCELYQSLINIIHFFMLCHC